MNDEKRYLKIKGLADNVTLIFPITPFIKFNYGVETETVNVFGNGEMDTGFARKLARATMDGLFPHPDNNYNFLLDNHAPRYFINWIYKWMNEQSNLYLTYCTRNNNISHLNCRIQEFNVGEEDGTKNVSFSLSLKEYKENKVQASQYVMDAREISKSYGSNIYYAEEGDTLITIATKLFGDSSKWSYLMNFNDLKNPLDISAGQAIKISL